jgi:serine/threonine-protein kinase HipA
VFNIAVSNTDDHLRNHGFILTDKGWVLSLACDINPSIDKDGLALNFDMYNNALDYDLAKSVGEFFRLNNSKMDRIIEEVLSVVSTWNKVAQSIGISKAEQNYIAKAFNV